MSAHRNIALLITLLPVALLSSLVPNGMAETPGCQNREDTERTPDAWWDKVKGAVFKVYVLRSDERLPRGTATLIDKRGYFLTASHIFEYPGDNIKLPDPTKEDLELVNHNGTMRLKAKEIFHRATIAHPDISLLKVEMDEASSDQVASIDPIFDLPMKPSRYILMGYKEKLVDPDYHEFVLAQPVSQATQYLRSRGDRVYYGESGSLGIIQTGQGVAILEGYEKVNGQIDRTNFRLTPLARGTSVLSRIEPTVLVKRLLDNLRQDKVAYVINTIENSNITAMELYLFVAEVTKNVGTYRAVLSKADSLRRALRYKLMCKNLYESEGALDTVLRFQTALTNIEGGQVATEVYRALLAKGIDAGSRRAALEKALEYFQRAEATTGSLGDAPGFARLTSSKQDYSRYQAEYAYVLNEGIRNYPDLGLSSEILEKKINTALTWDNKNELAYKLAAAEEKDKGELNGKLEHAIKELPEGDPKRSKFEEMRTKYYTDAVWKDPSITNIGKQKFFEDEKSLKYKNFLTK
jgi:hypothetical protein